MVFVRACRLCLDLAPDSTFFKDGPAGHSAALNENLKLKIYACTSLKVSTGDGLPDSVCEQCARLLDKFFLFRKMCWEVDGKLKLYLSAEKDGTPATVSIPEPVRLDEDLLDTNIAIKDDWLLDASETLKDQTPSLKEQIKLAIGIRDPWSSEIKNEQDSIDNEDVVENDVLVESYDIEIEEYAENVVEEIDDADNGVEEDGDVENDVQENEDEENCGQESEKSEVEQEPPKTKPEFYCEKCDESFKSKHHLKIHTEDNHRDPSKPTYQCKICTKPYRQLRRLENHLKIHEALGDIVLEDKKKKPSNDSDSDSQQQRLNEGDNDNSQSQAEESSGGKKKRARKAYDCEYCDQVFNSYTKYTLHELTHTGEKKYNCSDCSRSFTHKHSLIGHIREQHTGEVNFTCDVCGRGFVHRSTFNIHKKTHSTEKTLKCPDCDKCFTQMKNLRVHRQIHTAARTHTCQVCGKSFNFLKTLKVHLVLHSGEKPFVCTYCGKAFAQSAPLKTHTRIHTGERPYECKLCPSSYSTSNALKSHVLKHSGEAPYSCSVCNKGFNRKKDMIAHQEENHEVHIDMVEDMNTEPNSMTTMPHNNVLSSTMGLQQNCMQLQEPPPLAPMHIPPNLSSNNVVIASHHSPPPLVPFGSHSHSQMTLHASQQLHTMTHHPGPHLAASSNCMPHSSTHYSTPQMCTDLPGTDCSGG